MNYSNITSVKDVLTLASLDFQARFEGLTTDSGLKMNEKAIVGNGEIFGIAGKNYNIIQNDLFFPDILQVPLESENFKIKKAFQNKSKSVIELEYLNPNAQMIVGETFSHSLYIWNDFSGKNASGAQFRTLRLVCTNGMKSNRIESEFSIRHLSTFQERIETGKEIIFNSQEYINTLAKDIEKMKLSKVTGNDVLTYVKNMLNIKVDIDLKDISTRSKNNLENVLNIYETKPDIEKGTVWGLYNSYTDYFSHSKSFKEDQTDSVLFGAGSNELEKSYSLALQLTN